MVSSLRTALLLLVSFTLVLGLGYPFLVTLMAQAFFPAQANGSILHEGERAVGSSLIGQAFTDPGLFWGRPSATSGWPCNGSASQGSNLGPLSPALLEAVSLRIAVLRAADPGNALPVPADLVTASGSGLDPHITLQAALYQVGRVARARDLDEEAVRRLVQREAEGGALELLGPPRVNVLHLNLALERLTREAQAHGRSASGRLAPGPAR